MRRDLQARPHAMADAERTVRETWEALLGFEPIESDDRFIELGGSSLLAEQMLTRLRSVFSTAISPSDLVGDPTVAELAARIVQTRRRQFSSRPSSSVTLRDAGDNAPAVVCISGAGATTLAFLPLTSALPPTVSVYAFQAAGLESRAVPDWTVARAARRHLRSLRTIRPHGPYTVVAHSFGGHIATEMTRALLASGEQVTGLHLLDTVAIGTRGSSVADLVVTPSTPPSLLKRWATHARVYSAGLCLLEPEAHRAALWEQAIRAQNRYRVSALPPGSTVYVTEQSAAQHDHWRRLSPTAQVIDVPGDHNGILSDPNIVADIASRVVRDLASNSRDSAVR